MESLLRPVGPEPERVYWIRRALVLVAAVLALSLLMWLLNLAFGGGKGNETTAVPASAQSTSARATSSPGASTSTTPTPAPSSGAASASTPASSQPATPGSPSAPQSPSTPAASMGGSSAQTSQALRDCTQEQLKLRIAGPAKVQTSKPTSFTVSFTTTTSCKLDLKGQDFELRIYSGIDRIWSSNDCEAWQQDRQGILRVGQTFESPFTWTTQRSGKNCELKNERLRPGTYVATVEMNGTRPAQRVFQLVD